MDSTDLLIITLSAILVILILSLVIYCVYKQGRKAGKLKLEALRLNELEAARNSYAWIQADRHESQVFHEDMEMVFEAPNDRTEGVQRQSLRPNWGGDAPTFDAIVIDPSPVDTPKQEKQCAFPEIIELNEDDAKEPDDSVNIPVWDPSFSIAKAGEMASFNSREPSAMEGMLEDSVNEEIYNREGRAQSDAADVNNVSLPHHDDRKRMDHIMGDTTDSNKQWL